MHLYLGIAFTAFTTLAIEITLVRLLSLITWYHLAFFAISTAMLGMTAGAVTVYWRRESFAGEKLERAVSLACIAYALVVPLMLVELNLMPLGFERAGVNVMSVGAFILATLACALPFYFSGIAIAAVLTLSKAPIGRLYAADLLGAGAGCLFVLAGLGMVDAPSFVLLCGAIGGVAATTFAWHLSGAVRYAGLAVFVLGVGMAMLNVSSSDGIRPYTVKEQIVDPDRIQLERWNSYSHVVVDKPFMGPPQYWGASEIAPVDPIPQFWMRIDGAAGTTVRGYQSRADIEHLRYDITAAAYYLRPSGGACIIGVGGGRDLQTALLFGHEQVLGVDVNEIFIDLQQNEFAEFAGLSGRDEVTLVADEARSYLSRTDEKFSVVQMSLIDTWAATGAGAFSFTENALYTVEGWQVFLDHLKPDGLFTVSRWHSPENLGETGRTVSLAVAALLRRGITDPARHIAMLTATNLSTIMLSQQPMSAADIAGLRALHDDLGFKLEILPGEPPENTALRRIVASKSLDELRDQIRDETLNYDPPTDDSPYFFNMLRLGNLAAARNAGSGVLQGQPYGNYYADRIAVCTKRAVFGDSDSTVDDQKRTFGSGHNAVGAAVDGDGLFFSDWYRVHVYRDRSDSKTFGLPGPSGVRARYPAVYYYPGRGHRQQPERIPATTKMPVDRSCSRNGGCNCWRLIPFVRVGRGHGDECHAGQDHGVHCTDCTVRSRPRSVFFPLAWGWRNSSRCPRHPGSGRSTASLAYWLRRWRFSWRSTSASPRTSGWAHSAIWPLFRC